MTLLLLALLPFAPVWGWVCFGGLAGVVVHLRDALRGFSSLGWLTGMLSWKFTFRFRAAGLSAGCLRFYASLLLGEGSWFLRLAWRYGRCFWRRPLPSTWCFPDAGGNVSVSTFLGWFAILEVLVLKSRDSRFSWSLTLHAWCLEFWVPYPVAPPSKGGSLVLQIVAWGSRSSARHLASCFSLFARFRPALGLVFAALGYSMFGCSVALLPGASAVSFAFVMLT